jgi:hypothetical protein
MSSLQAGQMLGPYRITGQIGQGGIGVPMISLPDDLQKRQRVTTWFARFAVGLVFTVNVSWRWPHLPARALRGSVRAERPAGKVAVQGSASCS